MTSLEEVYRGLLGTENGFKQEHSVSVRHWYFCCNMLIDTKSFLSYEYHVHIILFFGVVGISIMQHLFTLLVPISYVRGFNRSRRYHPLTSGPVTTAGRKRTGTRTDSKTLWHVRFGVV